MKGGNMRIPQLFHDFGPWGVGGQLPYFSEFSAVSRDMNGD